MRILLTGGNGQIGRSLKRRQPDHWETIAARPGRTRLSGPQRALTR